MNEHDVIAFLRAEIRRIKPALPRELPRCADYRTGLHLDSLDLVELVARIEQRFGLLIQDSDLPKFTSLDATARYILARVEE